MKHIAISFTLKGQSFEDMKPVLRAIAEENYGPAGSLILVHGFMPKHVVLEKGFSTEVVDFLQETFPLQVNCYGPTGPSRVDMATVMAHAKGVVYVVGDVKDGVLQEVELYRSMGIPVVECGLDINLAKVPTHKETYGEKAVGLTFNPSGTSMVDDCKKTFAKAIDQMNDLRSNTADGEQRRLASVAITESQAAQMWAVKALTWRS